MSSFLKNILYVSQGLEEGPGIQQARVLVSDEGAQLSILVVCPEFRSSQKTIKEYSRMHW